LFTSYIPVYNRLVAQW